MEDPTILSPAAQLHKALSELFSALPFVENAEPGPDGPEPWRPLACGVYVLLDSTGAAVYVGETGCLRTRLRAHRRDKTFASVRLHPVSDPSERLALETAAILLHRPPKNRSVMLNLNKDGTLRPAHWSRK